MQHALIHGQLHGIEAAAQAGFRLRHQLLVADEAMVELEPLEGQADQCRMDAQHSPDLIEADHQPFACQRFLPGRPHRHAMGRPGRHDSPTSPARPTTGHARGRTEPQRLCQ